MLYYVYSKSIVTGKISRGTQGFPKEEAQKYADELNADPDNDGLLFWIAPVQEEKQDAA